MLHSKILRAMSEQDECYLLQGKVQMDDAYFGGERLEGKAGRGSESKVSIVAAISLNAAGHSIHAKIPQSLDSHQRRLLTGHSSTCRVAALCSRMVAFLDVVAIGPGRDFRQAMDEQVASCDVLLAIVGSDWLAVKAKAGRRRLEDPMDFVRLETASALQRNPPVIPILVRGASWPQAEQ